MKKFEVQVKRELTWTVGVKAESLDEAKVKALSLDYPDERAWHRTKPIVADVNDTSNYPYFCPYCGTEYEDNDARSCCGEMHLEKACPYGVLDGCEDCLYGDKYCLEDGECVRRT